MTEPPPTCPESDAPSLARATSLLASGSAVGQAAAFLLSPVLAALFDPAAFGVLATFVAVVSIVTVAAALRYELAVPLPAEDGDAAALVMLALGLCAISALASWPLLRGLDALGLDLLTPSLAAAAAVTVFASGGYEVLHRWAIRHERIAVAAASRVVQGLAVPVVQITLGWLALLPPAAALVTGYVAGRTAAAALLAAGLMRQGGRCQLAAGFDGGVIRAMAARYRRFPLYTTAAALMNALGARLLILYLAAFADAATAGLCAFAYLILAAPVGLIGQATAQIIHARGARELRRGGLDALVWTVFTTLVRTGLPVGFVLAASAPEVFALLFGNQWQAAGSMAQWLLPWLLVTYVASPLTVIPSLLDRQPFELTMQASLFAARTLALATAWMLEDHEAAIWIFSAASAMVTAAFLLPTLRLAGVTPRRVLREVGRRMAIAAALTLPVIGASTLAPERSRDLLTAATAAIALGFAAFPLLWSTRPWRLPRWGASPPPPEASRPS
jgi:O-antigen/teichoic acid export membrane protein